MRFFGWLFGRHGPESTARRNAIDSDGHIRPYTPLGTTATFIGRRDPREMEEALQTIQRDGLSPWDLDRATPRELTDEMIADAENTLRLKLPSSLLAILKIRNGGILSKDSFSEDADDYRYLSYIQGIGHEGMGGESLQTMPRLIWSLLEGYLDDGIYQEWWDTFQGEIHPDWAGKPRIPEAVLLLFDDRHWGIGLNYVRCGRQGEPSVVFVEMEGRRTGEEILDEMAPDFMSFLRMLLDASKDRPRG